MHEVVECSCVSTVLQQTSSCLPIHRPGLQKLDRGDKPLNHSSDFISLLCACFVCFPGSLLFSRQKTSECWADCESRKFYPNFASMSRGSNGSGSSEFVTLHDGSLTARNAEEERDGGS